MTIINWDQAPKGTEYFDTQNKVWYKKKENMPFCHANTGAGWYKSTFYNELLDEDPRFEKRPIGLDWSKAPIEATHYCLSLHAWFRAKDGNCEKWRIGISEMWEPSDICPSRAPNLFEARPTQTSEVTKMSSTKPFETKHYVFGQDVSGMTSHELITAIKKVEAEITDLKSVKTISTKITAKIAELEAMLSDIVKVLDAQ